MVFGGTSRGDHTTMAHWTSVLFSLSLGCWCWIALSTAAAAGTTESAINYDGYKVFRVKAETADQLHYLRGLSEAQSLTATIGAATEPSQKVDFWSEPRAVNVSADLMVAPDIERDLVTLLRRKNIEIQTLIDDVGRMLEMQKNSDTVESGANHGQSLFYQYGLQNDTVYFQRYQALSNIHGYMDDLVRAYPHLCSVETIGRSSEGRPLKIIKISTAKSNANKPLVWIDAGIHAREWIAPATALFIANKLIRNSQSDPEISSLLETFDFHILPSANPDGYEHSRFYDRFWRKTRSRNRSSFFGMFCIGVDGNRNYGFHWNEGGSSSNPCSNTFHGPHPFSEPEVRAIAEYVLQNKDRIKLFLSLHSFSQLILTPWGWTRDLPRDYNDMARVAELASRAIKMKYGTEYQYGSSTLLLYPAAGGADDWAYGAAGIKYSYTFELRDKGTYGFLLPARYIQPTGEETFDGVVAILNEIKKETVYG